MTGPLVVGDTVLDVDVNGSVDRVCPDAPALVLDVDTELHRPGGAGLAAVLAAMDGRPVRLVSCIAQDAARAMGERARAVALRRYGLPAFLAA